MAGIGVNIPHLKSDENTLQVALPHQDAAHWSYEPDHLLFPNVLVLSLAFLPVMQVYFLKNAICIPIPTFCCPPMGHRCL